MIIDSKDDRKRPTYLIVDGRQYELDIQPANCESLTHGHDAPHDDGSPGLPYHHHHDPRCAYLPLGATLRPLTAASEEDLSEGLAQYERQHPGGTELTAPVSRRKARRQTA